MMKASEYLVISVADHDCPQRQSHDEKCERLQAIEIAQAIPPNKNRLQQPIKTGEVLQRSLGAVSEEGVGTPAAQPRCSLLRALSSIALKKFSQLSHAAGVWGHWEPGGGNLREMTSEK